MPVVSPAVRAASSTALRVLAGPWSIVADPQNDGREKGWAAKVPSAAVPTPVPGIIQQTIVAHGVFWYHCRFTATRPGADQRAEIRFGAVDYLAEVWLNGAPIGGHEGGETPFALAVDAALAEGENLLAVRVLNPTDAPIDGISLRQTPCRNKMDDAHYGPGASYDQGGIMLPVELAIVPAVRVADLWARPDWSSGAVALTVGVRNQRGSAAEVALRVAIAPAAGGTALVELAAHVRAAPGRSAHELALTVPHHRLWQLDDPQLYRVTVALDGDGLRDEASTRIGFRDFRVVDGWFQLNGKRVFMRSTHTGNHFPIGGTVAVDPDHLRRDLIMAKAGGYNCVRFIAGMPWAEQLDFCDELGLMVYEENYSAWLLADSPKLAERFDRALVEMIQRDRNHPCLTVWGLLNETRDDPTYRHAVTRLPLVRQHDPDRLVLLSSGRWDLHTEVGSVANPGIGEWQHAWGSEGPGAAAGDKVQGFHELAGGYVTGAGDAHFYPTYPLEPRHEAGIRGMGQGAKPVFLSEFGIGSQFNAIEELRGFDRFECRRDLPDRGFIASVAERFTADWTAWGFASVYPFAEDFVRDSVRLMIRQRRNGFDLVRSNPQLCGYNLTGMLDHALTGEGLWTLWRRWKPGAAELLQDGWAPLRWSLFARPLHAYAGAALTIEAVLADEAVLRPGEHPVTLRVFAAGRGAVWERRTMVRIGAGDADRRPLAHAVVRETIAEGLPAGEYVLAACLESGGIAAADRLEFTVSAAPSAVAAGEIAVVGVADEARAWLRARGANPVAFDAASRADVVLVGGELPEDAALHAALVARAEAGATVIYASAAPFARDDKRPDKLMPLGAAVSARGVGDWLYHQDIATKRHPLFAGLQCGGALDWDRYGQVIGHTGFAIEGEGAGAVETVAAGFAVGYCIKGGYSANRMLAVLARGRGRIVLCGLRVLENLGQHPAADTLLANLIGHAHARR